MQEVGIELAAAYRHRVNLVEGEINTVEPRHITEAIEACFNKRFFDLNKFDNFGSELAVEHTWTAYQQWTVFKKVYVKGTRHPRLDPNPPDPFLSNRQVSLLARCRPTWVGSMLRVAVHATAAPEHVYVGVAILNSDTPGV